MVRGRQSNAAQQPSASNGIDSANSGTVITATKTFSTPMTDAKPIIASSNDNASDTPSDSTSTETSASKIISRFMTAAVRSSTVVATATVAAPITTTRITQTAKEAAIATDLISQDFVVAGVIFVCVVVLLVVTVMAAGCYFVRKKDPVKKDVPVVSSLT